MLGRPNAARAVGYALAALAGKRQPTALPGIGSSNHAGRISTPDMDGGASLQMKLFARRGSGRQR